MLREIEEGDYFDPRPPKSRALQEQVELAKRIACWRSWLPRRKTWDEIAAIEGVPKRTLQHFWGHWLDGLGVPRKRYRRSPYR